MAEDEIITNEPTTEVVEQTEDNSVIKQIRKEIAREKQARLKAEKELEAIRQAELDKTKTLEEKALEAQKKAEELEKQIQLTTTKYTLEKELLSNNVNPEFVDLMLEKAQTMEADVSEVIDELKSKYPSAFVNEKPKPIGKVGVSQTTGATVAMTKEEVERALLDPNTNLTPELIKLADEYGI